jgi:uncharacterized membrane protein HdeD (DUF308 family)
MRATGLSVQAIQAQFVMRMNGTTPAPMDDMSGSKMESAMFNELVRRWWIVALRGGVSVAFGIAAFLAPDRTMSLLLSLFGLFALADGVFTMGAGLAVSWLSLFLEGFVGISVGLLTLFFPAVTQLWLVPLIAVYAIVTGGLELAGAVRLRTDARGSMVQGDWLLGLSGAVSVVFGIGFWAAVELAAIATGTQIVLLGMFALVSGMFLLAFAFNVKTWPTVLAMPVMVR